LSHSHRDENELVGPSAEPAEPVVAPPPPVVVTNTEAERRAEERRKAEGVPEQTTQHQFTGDLPEPDRGGTETETDVVFGDGDDDDDGTPGKPGASPRRGPPAPRATYVEDQSWAAPARLDVLGTTALSVDASAWRAPIRVRENVLRGADVTRAWIRRPTGD
jgi:hypothetical protein